MTYVAHNLTAFLMFSFLLHFLRSRPSSVRLLKSRRGHNFSCKLFRELARLLMASTLESETSVKVFVSYSHDPLSVDAVVEKRERDRLRALHRAHALDLAEYLRRHGIDGRIDQYREDDPPESWPQWMERQIVECDYVLMVCTPSYFHYVTQEADDSEGSEKGLGSRFEGRIIYGYLTKKPTARKFIPIFFGPRQPKYIPHVIAQSASYQILFPLDMDMPEQRDLWRLYAKLTGQLTSERTPIGKQRELQGNCRIAYNLIYLHYQNKIL